MEWLVYFVLLTVTLCESAWWPHETHYSILPTTRNYKVYITQI